VWKMRSRAAREGSGIKLCHCLAPSASGRPISPLGFYNASTESSPSPGIARVGLSVRGVITADLNHFFSPTHGFRPVANVVNNCRCSGAHCELVTMPKPSPITPSVCRATKECTAEMAEASSIVACLLHYRRRGGPRRRKRWQLKSAGYC